MSRQFRPITVTTGMEEVLDTLTKVNEETGCWEWQGYLNNHGYGRHTFKAGDSYFAHRVSYTRHKGPIPDGLVLDHLCRNPRCINPEHLEAVTDQINVLRGMAPGAKAQRRDACLRGHLYAEYGKVWNVRRYCTACGAINLAAYKARQAEAKAA
jgi:hypothetical protein